MRLRDVFDNTKRGQLYRYLHFPTLASQWTLETDVLVEEPDPHQLLGNATEFPHPIAAGYQATVFSSDVEHIVNYADKLSGSVDDEVRLDALRYYFHNGHRVFEDWRPPEKKET